MNDLNNIIQETAKKSLHKRKVKTKNTPRNKKWHTKDLKHLKKIVLRKGELLCQYPRDPWIRGNYFSTLKQYRKQCKAEYRKYRTDVLEKLDHLKENNPKEYWALLKQLKEDGQNKGGDITAESWYEHYKELNSFQVTNNPARSKIEEELAILESIPNFSPLDYKISEQEIMKAMKNLRNNKAVGSDLISNEMLKYGQHVLLKPIQKMFNLILSQETFPTLWAKGRIISLHKKDDPSDPANYRGITISSCLGKLFNTVLNNRLQNFLDENNIIKPEQIGFQKKCRTSDHMFILKCLIDKYKKGKKELFLCFVDFKKAFDSVWHVPILLTTTCSMSIEHVRDTRG